MFMSYFRYVDGIPSAHTVAVKTRREGVEFLVNANKNSSELGDNIQCVLIEFKQKIDQDESVMIVNGGYLK